MSVAGTKERKLLLFAHANDGVSLFSALGPPSLKELRAAAVHLITHLHQCAGSELHNDL